MRSFLGFAGLAFLVVPVVKTGICLLPSIPVAGLFEPRIFSKACWHISRKVYVGIAVVALVQIISESLSVLPPVEIHRAFGAIMIAPLVEELWRAAIILPILEAFGVPAGVALTALLWALPHPYFWTALIQQTILCLIFIRTNRSLPATISAHFVINVIAVFHIGLPRLLAHI